MATVSVNPQKLKETHYTTREAADLLNVRTDTVKRYCNQSPPRLKAVKLFGEHGPWYIPESVIKKYLANSSDMGRPKAAKSNGQRRAS